MRRPELYSTDTVQVSQKVGILSGAVEYQGAAIGGNAQAVMDRDACS